MAEEVVKLTEKDIKTATEVVKELFAKLSVETEATVSEVDGMIDVSLQTNETGMIIGYHGETLEGLQLVLSLMVSKKLGRFVRVMIDVGDYRKQRTEYLEQLAQQMKESVLREQRERVITSLKSWERRVVHLLLQSDEQVVTESRGAGRDRVLVIKPR